MSVREQKHVAGSPESTVDHSLSSDGNLRAAFASRHAVAPQGPARVFNLNLGRSPSFVLTVIPLEQICVEYCTIAEAGEEAGFSCSVERAGQYECEVAANKGPGDLCRVPSAL